MTQNEVKYQYVKARNWTAILRPDADEWPDDWLQRLEDTGLRIAVSPLHDKDYKELKDGETEPVLAKPHYHILIMASGPITEKSVLKLTKQFGTNQKPKKVNSVTAMLRYFYHADQENKHKYDPNEIISLNGLDLDKYLTVSDETMSQIVMTIINFIVDNNIRYYHRLIKWAMNQEEPAFYQAVLKNRNLFSTICTSINTEMKNNAYNKNN